MMNLFQWVKAHLLKVMLSAIATLLIVQYWRQITLSSSIRLEPLLLTNSTFSKSRFASENGTLLLYEYGNGTYGRNVSGEYPEGSGRIVPICPPIPPNLKGPIEVRKNLEDLTKIEKDFLEVEPGGAFKPKECRPRYAVALVVPYRDRANHLAIFLNNIHRLLMRQQIEYRIFVVEQKGNDPFNRGKLMNVGYVEANKLGKFDCFIFHDVDLIPEDDRNLYTCPEQPRHMSVAIDKFNYRLPYKELFGGVCAFTTEHYKLINGFSNVFWGWGGEDDDLYTRLKRKGLRVSRYPPTIARYTMLPHEKQVPNPDRFGIIQKGKLRIKNKDGLYSLIYKRKVLENRKLYTWILVDLKPAKWWLMSLFHPNDV